MCCARPGSAARASVRTVKSATTGPAGRKRLRQESIGAPVKSAVPAPTRPPWMTFFPERHSRSSIVTIWPVQSSRVLNPARKCARIHDEQTPGPRAGSDVIMPVKFRCVYCEQLLGIARRKAGTVVKCPNCEGQLIVPTPETDEAADDDRDDLTEPAPQKESP